jgi:exoribonuclease R
MDNQIDTSKSYKVHINDRAYTSWNFYTTLDFKEVSFPINPVEHKLFTNDVFTFNETDKTINIIHSSTRSYESIAGVLILKNNKTYGRRNGKLLYKCTPDDRRIPSFLIPYEMKKMGFSKVFQNLYITFHYDEWSDKHPYGIISQTIGPVDVLDNFYEYQLYCKSLNTSIQKFTKDTSKALKAQPHDAFIENISKKYTNIEDRSTGDFFVFTIDPPNSCDYDDGFSIKTIDNGNSMLSIYISNVTLWMDILGLWESFSRRISTIYLPDRKRPMLPTILSDCLCSLQEKNSRLAFVMDIFINDKYEIVNIKYSNCKIRVSKNYCYEDPALLCNEEYQKILYISNKLTYKYKYIQSVRNSHDVVCYLMILMNYHTAKELVIKKTGIFRSTVIKNKITIPSDLPEDVSKFIKIWNSSACQYLNIADLKEDQTLSHDLLEMEAYIHITSPIRRLVDLLNMIQFQQNTGLIPLSENATKFYNKWINDLEYINTSMRSIRKVQNDCNLLHMCNVDPSIMENLYGGYTFDKIMRNDGLYQYIVYLPELKMTSRVTMRDNLDNYQAGKYKLYLFNDEENFKRKIRLQLITTTS